MTPHSTTAAAAVAAVATPICADKGQATLWVCVTCRISLEPGLAPTLTTDGRELFDLVDLLHGAHPLAAQVALQPVECMGGCERGCTAGIAAPGKYAYLFGGLEPSAEYASAMLECALLLSQQTGSVLGRIHRPALLRNSLLGRIPPLPSLPTLQTLPLSDPRNTAP